MLEHPKTVPGVEVPNMHTFPFRKEPPLFRDSAVGLFATLLLRDSTVGLPSWGETPFLIFLYF